MAALSAPRESPDVAHPVLHTVVPVGGDEPLRLQSSQVDGVTRRAREQVKRAEAGSTRHLLRPSPSTVGQVVEDEHLDTQRRHRCRISRPHDIESAIEAPVSI